MAIIDGDLVHHPGHGWVPLIVGCDCPDCPPVEGGLSSTQKEDS